MSSDEFHVLETGTILDEIVRSRKQILEVEKGELPLSAIVGSIEGDERKQGIKVDFAERLRMGTDRTAGGAKLRVIGEIKRASPSKGVFNNKLNAVAQAEKYAAAGCAAVSVLTEQNFFKGSSGDLSDIYEHMGHDAGRPALLRKDFLFDPYQIFESRYLGADAILLIVSILRVDLLSRLIEVTRELGMEALVEVHTEEELRIAESVGARVIGINNRNLSTFFEDLGTFERLSKLCSSQAVLVAESAISSRSDAERMHRSGATALLVGESLVRSGNVDDFAGSLMLLEK